MSFSVVINGRFLGAHPTGVQRVAAALVGQLDGQAQCSEQSSFRLLRPPGSRSPSLKAIPQVVTGAWRGVAWEQVHLPQVTGAAVLLNLCNTAPLVGRRNVVMIHDAQAFSSPLSYTAAFRAWYQFLLPRIGKRALRVITVSEYAKRQLAEYGISDPEKTDVIYNGVDHLRSVIEDTGVLERLDLGRTPYILAQASTQEHKNTKLLLSVFTDRRLRKAKLVFVGTEREGLGSAGLAAAPNVVFAGRVRDDELKALMMQARALAFPSLTEGFGLPPLEAMSLGCPTLVAPCGALPEVCGTGSWFIDPGDEAAWIDGCVRIIDDAELRRDLASRGRAQAMKFTWAGAGEKLSGVLRQVA